MKPGPFLLLVLAASGCTAYEYEEEVHLAVDGSGEIRMSGSRAAIEALHGLEEVSPGRAASLFEGQGVEIQSALETEREGKKFVHVEARFSDWDALCRLPAFRDRGCRLAQANGELAMELSLPSPRAAAPESIDPQALLALRYHFPGTVRHHNSSGGVERGNILSWKRTFREHFAGRPLAIEVRFDRRTILAATLSVMGLALGLVVASIATALWLMVRKGQSQLRAEAISACPSRYGHPSGG